MCLKRLLQRPSNTDLSAVFTGGWEAKEEGGGWILRQAQDKGLGIGGGEVAEIWRSRGSGGWSRQCRNKQDKETLGAIKEDPELSGKESIMREYRRKSRWFENFAKIFWEFCIGNFEWKMPFFSLKQPVLVKNSENISFFAWLLIVFYRKYVIL